jgi:hypothetical protein
VSLPEAALNEALRRALVVRAVGGAPDRELELGEEAVLRLAAELDAAEPRAELRRGLESLRAVVAGRPAAEEALDALLADDGLAWRCFVAARLAAELV